MFKNRKEVEY